ncbi:MAG: Type IV-A pilus assembly ATPase PilB [Candidatus Nomurabacteria bacterium GW2011_GWB1_37_5]|uniref:Type IV-A pilus assembly ATPase PilB n=1 Tax=Candidatus Nomurabacteria bacterium GW2011_GWB1_37_5 TaxID=1618742 RepID=A0A0G0JDZ8_9BACT|nr:MAG: Type IV-A pilus assembly ATPase PilB [Candidatus Nomurabacteria bacterium GW2011_GWB1_37_5]
MTFLEQLANQGIIKPDQITEILNRANQKHGGDLDQALFEFGLDEKSLLDLKSGYYNLPAKKINLKSFKPDLLKYIAEDSASQYKIVPIGLEDNIVQVGILNPENSAAMDALNFIFSRTGTPYKIYLISGNDFNLILSAYKGMTGQMEQALSDYDVEVSAPAKEEEAVHGSRDETIEEALQKTADKEKIVEEAPIIKMVAVLLRTAVEGGASDIHIENTGEKVKVRFRVDGILHTSLTLPMNVYSGVVARIKILAKLRLDEKRKPQDGGFSAKIEGRKIDFRVSTLPTYYGEKVVMRILDAEKGVKTLDKLGMSPEHMEMVKEALGRPYGLILITGPTGSGKSTTLYAMLNELDRERKNIVSLEDPVEYHIPDVNQSQVMPEIGYDFAAGLRSILRQDPNIIMVGEIRDKETAQLAIQAALTGHVVLSTLHTNNSIGIVPRLVDMGIDPYLIAPTLTLAMAQRLVPKACESGQKKIPMDPGVKMMIDQEFSDLDEIFRKKIIIPEEMYDFVPSAECPQGTNGRMGAYEMFMVDKEIEDVILKTPTEQEIYKVLRKKGMITMKEDAILKSLRGEIPMKEVYNL